MRGRKPDVLSEGDITDPAAPPPDWLSEDGQAEWRRVFPLLVERRAISTSDLGSLENYCDAQGTVREMARKLASEGRVVTTAKGEPRKHPAVQIQAEAVNRARLLAAELGLTPVSRSRPSSGGGDGCPGQGGLFQL